MLSFRIAVHSSCMKCSVHCTVCTPCAVSSAHCGMDTTRYMQCTLHMAYRTLRTLHHAFCTFPWGSERCTICTLHCAHCTAKPAPCILCACDCIPCAMHTLRTAHSTHCTLCTLHIALGIQYTSHSALCTTPHTCHTVHHALCTFRRFGGLAGTISIIFLGNFVVRPHRCWHRG